MRSRRDRRSVRLPLLVLLLLPACAASRATIPLAELRPGATVRVETQPGPLYQGQLRLVGPDSVRLTLADRDLAIPRSGIVDMAVHRSQWQRGAGIGALSLGLPGAAVMGLLCTMARSDNGQLGDEGEWADCAAIGALAGGAVGALLGGLIGSSSRRWLPVQVNSR